MLRLYSFGEEQMSMENWGNNIGKEKPKTSGRELSQCHIVQEKSHIAG
jgi:hypothetical protein